MAPIILIDDNSKGQRQIYGASFIDDDSYSSFISHYEHFNSASDLSFLLDAKCVFIHDSLEDYIEGCFDQNSHTARENIIDLLDHHSIPYVCFSDGHYSAIGQYDNSDNIVELKKSVFYSRLESFLKEFAASGRIVFHILAYGENYRKELTTRYARALFQKLNSRCPDEILSPSHVMPSDSVEPHYLELIVEMANPALGIDYNQLLDYIEDNDLSVDDFTDRLRKIINDISRYGKNNYTWK